MKRYPILLLCLLLTACSVAKRQIAFNAGIDYAFAYLENQYKGGEIRIKKTETDARWYRTPAGMVSFIPIQRNDSLIVPYVINYSVVKDSVKIWGERLLFRKKVSTK